MKILTLFTLLTAFATARQPQRQLQEDLHGENQIEPYDDDDDIFTEEMYEQWRDEPLDNDWDYDPYYEHLYEDAFWEEEDRLAKVAELEERIREGEAVTDQEIEEVLKEELAELEGEDYYTDEEYEKR